jgi:hypothetical protein
LGVKHAAKAGGSGWVFDGKPGAGWLLGGVWIAWADAKDASSPTPIKIEAVLAKHSTTERFLADFFIFTSRLCKRQVRLASMAGRMVAACDSDHIGRLILAGIAVGPAKAVALCALYQRLRVLRATARSADIENTIKYMRLSTLTRNLAKVEVASSSLVSRSMIVPCKRGLWASPLWHQIRPRWR